MGLLDEILRTLVVQSGKAYSRKIKAKPEEEKNKFEKFMSSPLFESEEPKRKIIFPNEFTTVTEYHDNGRKKKETCYNKYGDVQYEIHYDETGERISRAKLKEKETNTQAPESIVKIAEFNNVVVEEFYENGNKKSYVIYDKYGEIIRGLYFDETGLCCNQYRRKGKSKPDSKVYKPIEIENYKGRLKLVITFNDNGRNETCYNKNGSVRYIHDYDNDGNLIKSHLVCDIFG